MTLLLRRGLRLRARRRWSPSPGVLRVDQWRWRSRSALA